MSRLAQVLEMAREAGRIILDYYQSPAQASQKQDGSPLTQADLKADAFLRRELSLLEPSVPCLSEESRIPDYKTRRDWKRFWLVDPLDGTKEFLKKNGEFTVNIALIEDGEPTLGAVYVPAQGLLYYAEKGRGAWKQEGTQTPRRIFSEKADPAKPLVVVESRSHASPRLDEFLKGFRVAKRVRAGSSLKFCLVAEGRADLYPRFGPTMEWDVAAGDCVWRNSAREGWRACGLSYNKPDLRNGDFVIGF